MQFFLQLFSQHPKKKSVQVAEDMLHIAITSCNLFKINSIQSLQKVEPSSTLCNSCKPETVARQVAKARYTMQPTCNFSRNDTSCNDCREFLNHCKFPPEIAACNMSPTTCNGFFLQRCETSCGEKLHQIALALVFKVDHFPTL